MDPLEGVPTTSSHITSTLNSAAEASLPAFAAAINITATNDRPTWQGLFGDGLFATVKALPGALVWLITFTTITLPTFLFALFSMSLTVTMNATTL